MSKLSKLGQRVKDFRLDRGYSQKRLSLILGVSRATIARLEAGKPVLELTQAKIERTLNQTQVAA